MLVLGREKIKERLKRMDKERYKNRQG